MWVCRSGVEDGGFVACRAIAAVKARVAFAHGGMGEMDRRETEEDGIAREAAVTRSMIGATGGLRIGHCSKHLCVCSCYYYGKESASGNCLS